MQSIGKVHRPKISVTYSQYFNFVMFIDQADITGVAENHQRDGERWLNERDAVGSDDIRGSVEAYCCRNVPTSGMSKLFFY